MFLLSDVQLSVEAYVEDLNNVLNSGEVPGLFTAEERNEICDAIRKNAAPQSLAATLAVRTLPSRALSRGVSLRGSTSGGPTSGVGVGLERRSSIKAITRTSSSGGHALLRRRSR